MPTHQNSFFSLELAQNYFSQSNPIAAKIAQDIQETKLAYGQLWHSLKLSEHNDIINETLIKPEISLRYFDKFSYSSPASKSSYQTPVSCSFIDSNDSLTAALMKEKINSISSKNLKAAKFKSPDTNAMPNINIQSGFGRKSRDTFFKQKTCQTLSKTMHDEVLEAYHDEHSMPFSYKTNSQFNLHIFTEKEHVDGKSSQLDRITENTINTNVQLTISNYLKLQKELNRFMNKSTEKVFTNGLKSSNQYNSSGIIAEKSKSVSTRKAATQPDISVNYGVTVPSNVKSKKKPFMELYIDCEVPSLSVFTQAVYSDGYIENEERVNLMQNFSSNTASSSSTISLDYNNDDDEKTLCEDVKLLDSGTCFKKDFDFLNNW